MADGGERYVGKVTQKAVLFGPDGDVLVTRADGRWQPPGGTFEHGEALVGGLRREPREELGRNSGSRAGSARRSKPSTAAGSTRPPGTRW